MWISVIGAYILGVRCNIVGFDIACIMWYHNIRKGGHCPGNTCNICRFLYNFAQLQFSNTKSFIKENILHNKVNKEIHSDKICILNYNME